MTCKIPNHIENLKTNQKIKQYLAGIHFDTFRELLATNYFVVKNNMLQGHSDIQIKNKGRQAINRINQKYGKPIVRIDISRPRVRPVFVDVSSLLPEIEDSYKRMKSDMFDIGISYNGDSVLQTESLIEGTPSLVRQTLNDLSQRFNIPWTEDTNQSSVARFENGIIYVNTNKIAPDTAIHEFAHPFVSLLKKQNYTLYKSLLAKAKESKYKGKSIDAFVRKSYENTNYSETDLQDEVLVTAIGLAASDSENFSEPSEMKTFIDQFITWLKNLFSLKAKRTIPLNRNSTIQDVANFMQDPKVSVDVGNSIPILDRRADADSLY